MDFFWILASEKDEVIAAIREAGFVCEEDAPGWYMTTFSFEWKKPCVLPTGKVLYSFGTLVSVTSNFEDAHKKAMEERALQQLQCQQEGEIIQERYFQPPARRFLWRWYNFIRHDQADQLK